MTASSTAMGVFPFGERFKKRFDKVVKKVIETHTGLAYVDARNFYEASTAKMDVIRRMIEESRIVICDVSQKNPNVFLELGVAYQLRKPILLLCEAKAWKKEWNEKPPFDLQGREHAFYTAADLPLKISRALPDCLYRTQLAPRGWNCDADSSRSPSEDLIEIRNKSTVWCAEPLHRNFIVSYRVTLNHEESQKPDVRMLLAIKPDEYPQIAVIFPWESDRKECHITFFKQNDKEAHNRLNATEVEGAELPREFEVTVSLCWPNLVVESTAFKPPGRLYVAQSKLRDLGFPLHLNPHIGFQSDHRATISEIRIREVFM